MIRKFEVDAILTSDWHLRETVPICRIDDFVNEQWRKVEYVRLLSREHDCPIWHAGDLFDFWKPSPELLAQTICYLQGVEQFKSIYGQHDLPQHSLVLLHKSGLNVLVQAGVVDLFPGYHWNQKPDPFDGPCELVKGRSVMVWHHLIYHGQKPWPDCPAPTAVEILDRFPQYDLILTGDNHHTFVCEKDGRLLVNPGCLTRQAADEEFHRPCVFLWSAKTNTVRTHYIPIADGVVSREHIDRVQQKNDRIDAFVSRLLEDWQADLDFTENLIRFAEKNNISNKIMDLIWKSMEEE